MPDSNCPPCGLSSHWYIHLDLLAITTPLRAQSFRTTRVQTHLRLPMSRANREHQGRQDHSTKAIIYDPSSHQLKTEDCKDLNSGWSYRSTDMSSNSPGKYASFQVDLPWWRNRVDIYVDPITKTGFVATVQLNRLGKIKNWQRRFGHNYTVLLVKGSKPSTPSRTSSRSTTSMAGAN